MKFVTKSWIQTQLSNFASRISAVFARKTDIPTKTSQLTNDSGFKTKDTTYSTMTGATASAAGKAGLVPAPAKGNQEKFLRGDGTWQTAPAAATPVNNLLATTAGNPLDAVQGKVLDDKITALNNSFSKSIGDNILSYNESEDAYYIQHGADSVPKKLGSGGSFSEFNTTKVSSTNTNIVIDVNIGDVVFYYTNATSFTAKGVEVDIFSINHYCAMVSQGSGRLTITCSPSTSAWIGGVLKAGN